MRSILKLIIKVEKRIKPWIFVDWNLIISNPYVPDSILFKNREKLNTKKFLYRDLKLMKLYPDNINWPKMCRSKNELYVDLMLENIRAVKSETYAFMEHPSPKLAPIILEHANRFRLEVATNPNPGLTSYILHNWDLLPGTKYLNKNPKLFSRMMQDLNPDWHNLSSRNEPEFTEFLISHEKDLNWTVMSKNNNPELTELIIKNKDKLDYKRLTRNKNPKLMQLKIENKEKLDWELISAEETTLLLDNIELAVWLYVSMNKNSEITKLIMDNPDKLNYYYLPKNSNKKLDNFMYNNRHLLSHKMLSRYANIMEIHKIELSFLT